MTVVRPAEAGGDDDRPAGGARGDDAGAAREEARAPRDDAPQEAGRHKPRARGEGRAYIAAPRVPRLTLAHLSAPSATNDAGRARKLAAGALSLLVLALASATLLAFTARVERRRVVR